MPPALLASISQPVAGPRARAAVSRSRASAPARPSAAPLGLGASVLSSRRSGFQGQACAMRAPLLASRKANRGPARVSASAETRSVFRGIQHKSEAKWFYSWLSLVYDKIVNPGHWTEDMREDALTEAKLDSPDLKVYDVGGGTGFCTLGVVKHVKNENVTLIDQSPGQLAKARAKPALEGVTIMEGDAEALPFETDSADRYTSAGSIEYWPDPQRGICEAYRVIKPGGIANMIGPVHPTFPISRFMADIWMLFPTEQEYIDWYTAAGFTDVKIKRIGPKWYRGVRRHGLIMGCSVSGVKPKAGPSPLELGPIKETTQDKRNPLEFLARIIIGTLGGAWFFIVPVYMWIKNLIFPKSWEI